MTCIFIVSKGVRYEMLVDTKNLSKIPTDKKVGVHHDKTETKKICPFKQTLFVSS